jgi:hypothetical protein
LHIERCAGIDETGYLAIHLGDDKTFRPGGDALGDLLAGRGFVAFLGNGFDGVAAVEVSCADVTDDGVHGNSEIIGIGVAKHKADRPGRT